MDFVKFQGKNIIGLAYVKIYLSYSSLGDTGKEGINEAAIPSYIAQILPGILVISLSYSWSTSEMVDMRISTCQLS